MDNFTLSSKFLTKKTLLPIYLTKPLNIISTIKGNVLIVKGFLFYFKIRDPKIAHNSNLNSSLYI